MKKDKALILAASGTGKTIAAQKCENVVDLERMKYAFIIDTNLYGKLSIEEQKNLISGWLLKPEKYPSGSIIWNPECPENYIKAISNELDCGNTVLIPFIPRVYNLVLENFANDTRKILVLPEKDSFEEYKNRYIKRGNDENFIKVRESELHELAELFENAKGFEKIVLGKGKYLTEELVSRGICKCKK